MFSAFKTEGDIENRRTLDANSVEYNTALQLTGEDQTPK